MSVDSVLDIKFYYNGGLGVLQHKTQANMPMCDSMLLNHIINQAEWKIGKQQIFGYFTEQLTHCLANPACILS